VKILQPDNPVLTRTLRRAAQAAVILLAFYMVLIGGFVLGVREYRWRVITLVMLGLLFGGWYLFKLLRRTEPPLTPVDYPVLIMVAATGLATIFSTDPRISAGRAALNIILAISLYFTIDWLSSRWRASLLINALLLTGGVVCLVGLVEYWQWYSGNWVSPVSWREAGIAWDFGDSLRIKSVLHNPNYLAYYLILPIGLAFYKLFTTTRWQRGLWGGYLLVVLVTMILTQSRGGLLGAAATVIIATILYLWTRLGRQATKKIVKNPYLLLLAGLLLVVVGSLLYPIVSRTDLTHVGTLSLRDDIWRGAINIFMANPVVGAGPSTYPSQYMIYRNLNGHTAIFTHAHNVWLTIGAEYGLVGVLSVALFFIVLGRAIVNYMRRANPAQWPIMMLVGISLLVGQGVHNLVDDFMEFPIFTWYTVLAVALCIVPMQKQASVKLPQTRRGWLLLVGAGLLITAGGAVWTGPAFAAYDQARFASQNGDWPQATRWLEQAVKLDPTYRFYRQQLALAYGEMARTDDSYLPLALAQQEQVYSKNTHYSPDAGYLACLYWQSEQPEQAIETMQKAVAVTPPRSGGLHSYHLGQTTFLFNLAYYLEYSGQPDMAGQIYQEILQTRPQLVTSSFWAANNSRQRLAEGLTAPSKLYPNSYQPALNLIQNGKLTQAEDRIKQEIAARSSLENTPPYFYLWGQLSELQGDPSLAEQKYRQAIAASTTIRTDYANLVGQRQPLAKEKPFCLMIPYPAEYLSKPSLALAQLLVARQNLAQAVSIYQTLLRYEPYNLTARQQLEEVLASYSEPQDTENSR